MLAIPEEDLKLVESRELWVLGGAIIALILGIYFATGGGISQKVSQNLGLRDGVIEIYNQNASSHNVYAEIKGVWATDRTSADGRYLILGTSGSEFIVSDGKGVYRTHLGSLHSPV